MNSKDNKTGLIKTNSFLYKIKNFFIKLFNKSKVNQTIVEENVDNINSIDSDNSFRENIKKIENEETKLLKLQEQFKRGEVEEKDLTEEQINALCKLYHEQIKALRKSNKIRKEKLLEYRKNIS